MVVTVGVGLGAATAHLGAMAGSRHSAAGSATFTSTEPSGKQTDKTVRPRGRRPGGGEKGMGC